MQYRYFIYLAYDGSLYNGWQIQPNGKSIQETLMKALFTFLRKEVSVTGAGRTDSGVHARLMVAHFDFDRPLAPNFVCEKLNRILPADIAVYQVKEVKSDAHARFDALSRTYQYFITTRKSPFNRLYSLAIHQPLNVNLMNQAAQLLFEYKDFTSFSKLHTDTKTNLCEIKKAEWKFIDEHTLVFTIQANRFLRNMVRAIVGTLLEVGLGRMSLEQFRGVIEQKDRGVAGASVPGHALFLMKVDYPQSIFKS